MFDGHLLGILLMIMDITTLSRCCMGILAHIDYRTLHLGSCMMVLAL
jgi:hypothetical protein